MAFAGLFYFLPAVVKDVVDGMRGDAEGGISVDDITLIISTVLWLLAGVT